MEFREGDSLEGSAHTPMYNPNILPLTGTFNLTAVQMSKRCGKVRSTPLDGAVQNIVYSTISNVPG